MLPIRLLFVILFIASNLVILPLYYRAERQNFRGLVSYLKGQLRKGDKLFDSDMAYTPGILHYFGVYPEKRHYEIPYYKVSENEIELGNLLFFKTETIQSTIPVPVVTDILPMEAGYGLLQGKRREEDQREFSLCFKRVLRWKFSQFQQISDRCFPVSFPLGPQIPRREGD